MMKTNAPWKKYPPKSTHWVPKLGYTPQLWLSKLAMQHSLLSTIRKKGIIVAAHEAYMRIAYIIDFSDNF